ncbi:hypothetical protein P7K49_027223, partial [Saguinus oedipus]
ASTVLEGRHPSQAKPSHCQTTDSLQVSVRKRSTRTQPDFYHRAPSSSPQPQACTEQVLQPPVAEGGGPVFAPSHFIRGSAEAEGRLFYLSTCNMHRVESWEGPQTEWGAERVPDTDHGAGACSSQKIDRHCSQWGPGTAAGPEGESYTLGLRTGPR